MVRSTDIALCRSLITISGIRSSDVAPFRPLDYMAYDKAAAMEELKKQAGPRRICLHLLLSELFSSRTFRLRQEKTAFPVS